LICGAAIVHADGEVVELDGATGARLLRESAELARFARAFAASGERRLAGLWRRGPQLLSLGLEAEPGDPRSARVELAEVDPPYGLTRRELEVVTLMTGGLSNDDIGALLGCGGRTVGKHVERILGKLDLATRASVAALAVEQGLLVLPLPGSGRALAGLAAGRVQALARGGRPRTAAARRPARRMRYLIGSAYPRGGPVAADGDEMVSGSALAITEINRRGGIAGRHVEQVVVDVDPLEPHSVVRAIESLVEAEVDAITAGWMLPEREAVDAAAPYGCPLLSAFTSEYVAGLVREQQSAYGSIFQVCATEAVYGRGFIRWLDGLEASGAWRPASRRLLFIEPRVQSSHMANEAALQAAERSGWQLEVESTPARMASWGPVIDTIRNRDPAALLLAQWLPDEAAGFQRAFAADPTDALVYVVYSPSIPAYVERAGEAAEGVLWSTVTGSYGDAIGRGFAQRFQQQFGRAPGRSHAGIAYDEVHLLADAWARVGNPRRFGDVARELSRVPHRGVNGVYYLNGESHCALSYPDTTDDPSLGQAHLVLQIQDGQSRALAPSLYAESSFRVPSWTTAAAAAS
jgi:branched-chain amino acid transport system substrate-binding protein